VHHHNTDHLLVHRIIATGLITSIQVVVWVAFEVTCQEPSFQVLYSTTAFLVTFLDKELAHQIAAKAYLSTYINV
jgi:hypothetical protein